MRAPHYFAGSPLGELADKIAGERRYKETMALQAQERAEGRALEAERLMQARAKFENEIKTAQEKKAAEAEQAKNEKRVRLHQFVARELEAHPERAGYYTQILKANDALPDYMSTEASLAPDVLQRFSVEAGGAGAAAGIEAPALLRDPMATDIELDTGAAPNTPEARAERARRDKIEANEKARKAAEGRAKADLDKANKVTDRATGLRKEWEATPTYKYQSEVDNAVDKIEGTSATGAGDMSLVYGFMKLQDPTTGVKEGEFASAKNAGGVEDWVRNTYNKVKSGEFLTPEQREHFRAEGRRLAKKHREKFDAESKYYIDLATKSGIDPADVIKPQRSQPAAGNKQPPPRFNQQEADAIVGGR